MGTLRRIAMLRVAVVLLLVGATTAQISLGVPSKRYLLDTSWGQLHYVTSLAFNHSRPTLALFHSNPHSHLEFKQFLSQPNVREHFNFAAFDYFGCGGSDDCLPPACGRNPYDGEHPYVTIQEFVSLSLSALRSHGVHSSIGCIGHLKGGSAAIECAKQLGSAADIMMSIDPLYFDPSAVPIVKKYTNHTINVTPLSSGQHLLDAWFQPSVGPCDFVNATYCEVWRPQSLELNELKTLDRIRSFGSQWQYIMAGLGYNDQLIDQGTMEAITASKYIGWGTTAMSMWATDGFLGGVKVVNSAWSKATRNRTKIDYVEGANEGSMMQNASYYASVLHELYFSRDR